MQQAALEEYGAHLHVALRSRRHELLYLRRLTEMLLPFLMPPKATECRQVRGRRSGVSATPPAEPDRLSAASVQVFGSAAAGGDDGIGPVASHGLPGRPREWNGAGAPQQGQTFLLTAAPSVANGSSACRTRSTSWCWYLSMTPQ